MPATVGFSTMEIATTMEFTSAVGIAAAEVFATAMEALAASESTAATKCLAAMESSITATAECFSASESWITAEAVMIAEVTTEPVVAIAESSEPVVVECFATEVPEAPALVQVRMPEVEVVPGTGANEDATYEPLRTPVAVRRASKRIIWIVSVIAHRRRIVIAVIRADLDPNGNLRISIDCRDRQNCQQGKIFKITHFQNLQSAIDVTDFQASVCSLTRPDAYLLETPNPGKGSGRALS